jgi:hypothetical protein
MELLGRGWAVPTVCFCMCNTPPLPSHPILFFVLYCTRHLRLYIHKTAAEFQPAINMPSTLTVPRRSAFLTVMRRRLRVSSATSKRRENLFDCFGKSQGLVDSSDLSAGRTAAAAGQCTNSRRGETSIMARNTNVC